MNKTVKYLLILAALVGLNLFLFFYEADYSSSSFDAQLFTIADTTQINSISIQNNGEQIELQRNGASWQLNQTYQVDQSFLRILFTILNKVNVKRQVGQIDLPASGEVMISFADGSSRTFSFASDAIGTKSFFIESGTGYQVEVPGYRDNIVNIFELNADQWRNRVVFNGSWRTIQNLTLQGDQHDLNIQFNNQFFEVEGISPIDSTGVVDYLNLFQQFQANEMLSKGRFPELDAHLESRPLAILTIEDIQMDGSTSFEIYSRLENQSYHLVTKNGTEMMVFDGRRIDQILKSGQDFTTK